MSLGKYLHLAMSCGFDYRAAMLVEIATVYEICELKSKGVKQRQWQPVQ